MKICSVENCNYPCFGKGLCRNHQFLRSDKKHRPIPVHSKKKPVHEVSFGFDSQIELFQYLWENAKDENGNVFCKYTGRRLNGIYHSVFSLSIFAHILPKKNYPYFKLNPENVETISPDFHTVVDQGTNADRAKHPEWKWDLWDAKVIYMKNEYQKYKNENLLS